MAMKVFAIEDDPDYMMWITYTLKSAGHVVTPFANGRECLRHLESTRKLVPDLILCNLHLRDISGEEFVQELRKKDLFHTTPVAFISGETNIRAIASKYKVAGFVAKGSHFPGESLLAEVRRLCPGVASAS